MMRLVVGVVALLAAATAVASERDDVLSLLADMENAWSQIDDYSKRVEKTERLVSGKMTQQVVVIKHRQPDDFYMKVLEGANKGGELIYPSSDGSNMVVAHAGGFKGGVARFLTKTVILRRVVPTEFRLDDPAIGKWQHQTVLQTSFGATIAQIASNVRLAIENDVGAISRKEECESETRCLLRLDFEFPADVGEQHEVKEGETLWTIASSYGKPMYGIWYNNPEVAGPEKVRPGQTLFIPEYYAARGTVWVSPELLMPTKIEILDANGELYERYVYSDLEINIGLTDLDFDAENPDYRF